MEDILEPFATLPVVIVAEDEAVIRMLANDILSDAGFRVFEAVSADEALQLLGARPDTVALVTDLEMPGSMNGFALARLVAAKHPKVGLVVASGRTLPCDEDMPRPALFLQKPYAPSALIGAVRDVARAPVGAIVVEDAIAAPQLVVEVMDAGQPIDTVGGD